MFDSVRDCITCSITLDLVRMGPAINHTKGRRRRPTASLAETYADHSIERVTTCAHGRRRRPTASLAETYPSHSIERVTTCAHGRRWRPATAIPPSDPDLVETRAEGGDPSDPPLFCATMFASIGLGCMSEQIVWWATIVLEIVVLVRAVSERLAAKFPIFYFYVTSVLLVSLLRMSCYRFYPNRYQNFYWYTEFLSVLAGYGVIFEIYKTALKNHPGVSRRAQKALLVVLFVTLIEVAVNTFNHPNESWVHAIAKLGRDLRYVELTLWVVMLAVFSLYLIPASRSLKGLISGYGLFIALSVVNLAFVSQPGNPFAKLASKLAPAAYLVTLLIWCGALWSLHPEPAPPPEDLIERDYQALALRTWATFKRAKSLLVGSIRP